MITKVEFHNFKALRDVSIDLERLTVLVGANGSGKTSALEGFHYLCQAADRQAIAKHRSVDFPLALRSSGAEDDLVLGCATEKGVLRLSLGSTRYSWHSEDFDGNPLSSASSAFDSAKVGGSVAMRVAYGGAPFDFGPAIFLRLDANRIVAPSYSDEPVPSMDSDGAGLPSVLAYLASSRASDYSEIEGSLRSVVPAFRTARFPRAPVTRQETEVITVDQKEYTRQTERRLWGNSIEFDMVGACGIPGTFASEGTVLVLGMLTVIMGPNRPRIVLLDDLDRALHPKAQRQLVGLLRRLLDQKPDLQIIATSHSPYLLDELRPEEVRLTALTDEGAVAVGRLDQHPEFDKWKEEMSPGEFWSMVGEQWVAETAVGT